MPDTVPQFSAKTWRAPNLAISSIAGNIQPHLATPTSRCAHVEWLPFFRGKTGYGGNLPQLHDDLQILRWKYKRNYSAFFKTTPVFKANFAMVNLLRMFILRP